MSDAMSSESSSVSSEWLSALMDGELDDMQRRRVVQVLLADPAALAQWRRFHLARAALRGDSPQLADQSAAARLRAAIADEPIYSDAASETANDAAAARINDARPMAAGRRNVPVRASRLVALAVAAAAGAGVIVWNGVGTGRDAASVSLVASVPAVPTNVQPVMNAGVNTVDANTVDPVRADSLPELRRARMYMLLHAQQAATNQSSQVIPFVKAVSYETP